MQFRITNITKKPGHTKGKFKKGFFVDVRPAGKPRPMWVGESVIVGEITPGLLAMQSKEYISIESVKDLDVQIKKQIEKNEAKSKATIDAATKTIIDDKEADLKEALSAAEEAKKPVKETAIPSTGLNKDAMKEDAKLKTAPKAVISGGEEEGNDPIGDVDDSINPDGQPNFVVKPAKRKGSR